MALACSAQHGTAGILDKLRKVFQRLQFEPVHIISLVVPDKLDEELCLVPRFRWQLCAIYVCLLISNMDCDDLGKNIVSLKTDADSPYLRNSFNNNGIDAPRWWCTLG